MHRTRIKICGICRPEDALAAASAGADAIGINFDSKSARFVDIESAAQIQAVVPPFVSVVGLFVDATLDEIQRVAKHVHLSAIQLHGSEGPELVAQLAPMPVIKAVRPSAAELAKWKSAIDSHHLTNLVGLLLESPFTGGLAGGSGVPNDWETIARLRESGAMDGLGPLNFAGGLTPETVGEIVRRFGPFAVDVSSGVESAKRQKSAEKLAAFIKACHKADHDLAGHKKHA